MAVETARQEVVAVKAALESDPRLVQRPEQHPVCVSQEEDQGHLRSNDTALVDMGVMLRLLKDRWPGTQDRIEQQISAVSMQLETLLKGNADAQREIHILQGWSQEDKADHPRREARITDIENTLDAVNTTASSCLTSESVDRVVRVVKSDNMYTPTSARHLRVRRKKNQEKDAQPEKIKRKIDYSDLRNPPKNFTPPFGEVAKFRLLTGKEEQQSRNGDEVERCLPQNT